MKRLLAAVLIASLAACASTGSGGVRPSPSAEDVRPNPHQKVGKPYKIAGKWYRPRHDPDYDERGVASWYGPKFHGKLTANGEVFDMNRLTAAHPTLPLPSLVRVTNLANGRQVVLRVNDRGPFAHDRVLDLSRAAAEKLGTREAGLARVRVEYLSPAPMREAITRLGEPEAYADGSYAVVVEPEGPVRATVPGEVAETVRTRIQEGEEIPAGVDTVRGIAIVVADIEEDVLELPVTPAPAELAAEPRAMSARVLTEDELPERFYVQVGAYASPENAAAASAKLPEAVPISLTTDEDGIPPLTRLRIGPYQHEFPAKEALRLAVGLGFADARIVTAR